MEYLGKGKEYILIRKSPHLVQSWAVPEGSSARASMPANAGSKEAIMKTTTL